VRSRYASLRRYGPDLRPKETPELSNDGSRNIMGEIDRMTPAMRRLVHEYGFSIVHAMREDGYTNARALEPILETWRERRQQELADAPPRVG
jgi:hypothetical protein